MMRLYEEAARCLLCEYAACTQACEKGGDPARMIRAVRFENASVAARFVDPAKCAACPGNCEKACIHYDSPLRVRKIAASLPEYKQPEKKDLSIDFLGVHCENPFFLSSSIVASNYEMCARAFEMGWAGIVYKTIGFLTPEEVSPRFDAVRKEGTPFIGFKNLEQISDHSLSENLEILRKLKQNYPTKVVVASIMGQNDLEWSALAKMVTEAGCDIIECNFSCPHMSVQGLGSDVGQSPELVERYTRLVKNATHLPVLAKMTPNIGNMEIPAMAAVRGGADGLAAINTVKCITGLDLDTMQPHMSANSKSSVSGYSGKAVKPIALRFIHDLAKCRELEGIPLSGMGGVETWRDALEFIALGCSNIQVTTAVMEYGYRIIDDLLAGLEQYLSQHKSRHVRDLVGAALDTLVPTDRLDRQSMTYPVIDKSRCVGCGRCYISCRDAGHQALQCTETHKKPRLDGGKCVGCHLCSLVCPVGAISQSKRVQKTITA
ncbi:MAG: NAD-dependent dihydropyrimidine dehydrogenase subunit PreA [Eubacteriales bacterium]